MRTAIQGQPRRRMRGLGVRCHPVSFRVPRRVPKHGSVPQPHVPLHQRLCRAVPRRAAACSRLSLSVCPRAVSVRCRRVPAAPGHSPLTRLPSRVMNRPP